MKLARWLVLGCTAIALSGCQAVLETTVTFDRDGAGSIEVTLVVDQAAAEALKLGDARPRLADLTQQGWKIEAPETVAGRSRVRVKHEFAGPEELTGLVRQITGDQGPIRGVALERSRQLLADQMKLSAALDSTDAVALLEDEGLVRRLTERGVDVEALRQAARSRTTGAFEVELRVMGPRTPSTDNSTNRDGVTRVWRAKAGERVDVEAEYRFRRTRQLVALAVAVGLGLAAGILALATRRRL